MIVDALVPAFAALSPAGTRARLSILIFHRVLPAADPIFPEELDATRFEERLRWIRSWFNVLPLGEGIRRLAAGTLPARAASITFDDGYADNFSVAMPLLQRHGLTATFFVATGFIDGGCMWNDVVIAALRDCLRNEIDLEEIGLARHSLATPAERRQAIDAVIGAMKYIQPVERDAKATRVAQIAGVAIPTGLMMTKEQVRGVCAAGMQVGAHTVRHPILAGLSTADVRREVQASRAWLEDATQRSVELFAYPNGKPGVDYRKEDAQTVRELGFMAAVSTSWGAASRATDVMQLPRFTPWDRARGRFGVRLIGNLLRTPAAV